MKQNPETCYNMDMNNLFKTDETKCVKCGACVRDCAFCALSADADGSPRLTHPERCMRCQHCLAVCPTGAVTFDGRSAGGSVPLEGLELPGLDAVENWMRTRRSMRHFAAEDVDRATLERILKALGNSPTGCNARALTFTCFPTRSAIEGFKHGFIRTLERHRDGTHLLPRWLAAPAIKLRNGTDDMFFRGASGLLIVSSDETAPGVTTPREDVTIACSNFEFLANAAGIATCWFGFLKIIQETVPEILEATIGLRRTSPFYAILFGRPDVRYKRGVQRDAYANVDFRE